MTLRKRIKECSYLWLVYLLAGQLFSVVIGLGIYMLALVWGIFYKMDTAFVTQVSEPHVKYLCIIAVELIFIFFVFMGLYTESGDTVLIDIIKKGGKVKGSKLIDETSIIVDIKDIDVYLNGRREEITSLADLVNLNKSEHGYIKFKNTNIGFDDVCFVSDLQINALGTEYGSDDCAGKYQLNIKRYRYKGFRLLGEQEFNTFELVNIEDESLLDVVDFSFEKNSYILRLLNNGVYNYPVSLEKDIKEGLRNSRFSIGTICMCGFILFGIYGFYRNYSASAFMSDFDLASNVDGIEILSDNYEKYEKFDIYIRDSIALLPDKLKKDFVADGWSLVFVEDDLADYNMLSSMVGYGETSGCTFPFYKLIVIKIPDRAIESNKAYLMETVTHEFGHFLALKTGALNETWQQIYDKDKANYNTDYARTSMSEGFACEYTRYILDKQGLEMKTPATYQYLNKVVDYYLNQ